jgi:DNA-binding CsgD family transcriptional regulator
VRTAQDRPAEAMAVAGAALDHIPVARSPRYVWPLLVAAARACTAADRDPALAGEASALRGRLRTAAAELGEVGLAQPAHRLTFEAEIRRGDAVPSETVPSGTVPGGTVPGDMGAAWDAAVQAWETVGQPYPLGLALHQAAGAALAAGDRDRGAAQLRRAAMLAEDLGAQPLRDAVALLARRARVQLGDSPAAGPGPAGQPDRLGLTAREFEVLRLVAAGQSNRDIASELFISVKTASVHVSNILGKLGVSSRGEAAATAHRLRLFDTFPAGPPEAPAAPAGHGR